MRIIDSRTKEGREELNIKKQFDTLISHILVYDCPNKPGEFIKRYGRQSLDDSHNISNNNIDSGNNRINRVSMFNKLKSDYIKDNIIK